MAQVIQVHNCLNPSCLHVGGNRLERDSRPFRLFQRVPGQFTAPLPGHAHVLTSKGGCAEPMSSRASRLWGESFKGFSRGPQDALSRTERNQNQNPFWLREKDTNHAVEHHRERPLGHCSVFGPILPVEGPWPKSSEGGVWLSWFPMRITNTVTMVTNAQARSSKAQSAGPELRVTCVRLSTVSQFGAPE